MARLRRQIFFLRPGSPSCWKHVPDGTALPWQILADPMTTREPGGSAVFPWRPKPKHPQGRPGFSKAAEELLPDCPGRFPLRVHRLAPMPPKLHSTGAASPNFAPAGPEPPLSEDLLHGEGRGIGLTGYANRLET